MTETVEKAASGALRTKAIYASFSISKNVWCPIFCFRFLLNTILQFRKILKLCQPISFYIVAF